jgi:hypothetical protein
MLRKLFALALCLALAAPALATDLSITAANVKATSSSAKITRGQLGETVTQGQALYRKESDGKYYKADADAGTDEPASASAIAITPGATSEYAYVLTEGPITIGATLTVGEIYVLSGAAGGICPESDLATADRVTFLGVATSATVLNFKPFASAAIVP